MCMCTHIYVCIYYIYYVFLHHHLCPPPPPFHFFDIGNKRYYWKQSPKLFWSGRLVKMIFPMIYFAVSFSATPINEHQKPPKRDASPCNLCPLCSWPLQHFATKENSGWKLYRCIGIYLHFARRHFLTVI